MLTYMQFSTLLDILIGFNFISMKKEKEQKLYTFFNPVKFVECQSSFFPSES